MNDSLQAQSNFKDLPVLANLNLQKKLHNDLLSFKFEINDYFIDTGEREIDSSH